ncbi:hypothetical protein D3C87_769770 [compost metagenome]
MSVEYYCPRWGSEHLAWEDFCAKVKHEGYDGIEVGIANNASQSEMDEIWNLAGNHQLKLIPQFYDSAYSEFSKHFDVYSAWLKKLEQYPCVKIDSQTGRDIFSFEQNRELILTALHFTQRTGINVMHETHRHKCLFAAHVAKNYFQKIQGLKITLDASHWVCVGESFLEDQAEAMELAIACTGHIHARVGYTQGPQVPDPRANEWQPAVAAHLGWWDRIAARQKQRGEILTITSEFGPYPYMVHLPGTTTPITSQWEVNVYMMQLLKNRYQ